MYVHSPCFLLSVLVLIGVVFLNALLGYESRQPSHDLLANFSFNPLEECYNLSPHSLRNIGEETERLSQTKGTEGTVFFFHDKLLQ